MSAFDKIRQKVFIKLWPRWRRFLPDLLKFSLALVAVLAASLIWYKPPLIRSRFPYLSYAFRGTWHHDAVLYRPLAMPTRYYIALPRTLARRYEWFAVDRRREVAALTKVPKHHLCGIPAIKRGDSLGLDLEFRKLDNAEWHVNFFADAIVFSNDLLCVRLDVHPPQAPTTE